MKRCSTVRDNPEGFTELHEEEEREEENRGEQKEKKGDSREERQIYLDSTLFPKCSPQPRTPTEIH